MIEQLMIYGAGGFSREVAWLIDTSPGLAMEVVCFIDDHHVTSDGWPDPRPVLDLSAGQRNFPAAHGAIGVGDPVTRRLLANKISAVGIASPALHHASVSMSDRNKIGEGSIICAGCILTVDINIGRHVHINLDCTVGHDVVIHDYVTISPGVHVSGNVHIHEGAFIGTGANLLNGMADEPLVIGKGCVIAAGACVTRSTDPHTLYAGVPAVAKKKLG